MARQGKDGSFPDRKKNPAVDKLAGYTGGGNSGTFDWGDVDAQLLTRCVGVVSRQGDAISFSTNQAHTGGSITLLSGGERPRYPVWDALEADALLRAISMAYGAEPE
jgi:hypothetical protein